MIKIEEREILVESAWISLQTDSVIVIEIDCKSKYAQVCGHSQGSFALCADEHTLHKGTIPGYTDIELDLPDGFCISSISTGRYDVRTYCVNEKLMRQQEPKMIWETGRK